MLLWQLLAIIIGLWMAMFLPIKSTRLNWIWRGESRGRIMWTKGIWISICAVSIPAPTTSAATQSKYKANTKDRRWIANYRPIEYQVPLGEIRWIRNEMARILMSKGRWRVRVQCWRELVEGRKLCICRICIINLLISSQFSHCRSRNRDFRSSNWSNNRPKMIKIISNMLNTMYKKVTSCMEKHLNKISKPKTFPSRKINPPGNH